MIDPDETEITPRMLRDWLEAGQEVEVVDIRPRAEFEEWHIQGSRNVDAYEAIHANNPGPLAEYQSPSGAPVVVVCFVGQTSRIAVEYLRWRGIPAVSLAGGIYGWRLGRNSD